MSGEDFLDIEATIENIDPTEATEDAEFPDPAEPIANFRCNARVFFLTYPRCPVPSGDALAELSSIIGERLSYICVGHELHKDGGDHLHVVFQVKVT